MRAFFPVIAAAAAAATGSATDARQRPAQEWSQAAVDDLHFIRSALRENHPGPVDTANPSFRDWYQRGFDEALSLAQRAKSYAGYYFAIQKYTVGFQDGHLGALGDDRFSDDVKLNRQWPGLVVGLDHDRFQVVESASGSPPVGAVLEGCDGRSADALADEILRPYLPLWSLRGSRFQNAPFLLIDEGNPFVRRPEQCAFRFGNRTQTVYLNWTPIANAELAPKIKAAQQHVNAQTGIRPFGKNGWWITLASFNANSDAESAPLLAAIRTLETDPQRFRNSDVLVFDVRGNLGGNSEFGKRVAAAIWGAAFVDNIPTATAIDWRVSPLDLRQLERSNLPALEKRFGKDDPKTRSFAEFVENYRAALKRGDMFYRETFPQAAVRPRALPVRAKIFLLTDGWCHSACLDFADIVLGAPGVTQVGAETSADTVYIDNTGALLPSGEGVVGWSMKVNRGRPRSNNQSYVPKYVWNGPMTDTPGIERWIAKLAR